MKHTLEMLGSAGKTREVLMIKGKLVHKREKEKTVTHYFLSYQQALRGNMQKKKKEKESFKDGKNHLTMILDSMRSPHLPLA